MSASTIVIKNPPPSATLSVRKSTLNNATYSIVVPTLWLVSAVFAAARADTSPNGTGYARIIITYLLYTGCFTFYCTGFKGRCGTFWSPCIPDNSGCDNANDLLLASTQVPLYLPWVGMMAYSIYFTHYKGLLKMVSTFRYARVNATLPWLTVALSVAALVIRTFLTMRVLQLSTYLWYRKRLEKELYYQLME